MSSPQEFPFDSHAAPDPADPDGETQPFDADALARYQPVRRIVSPGYTPDPPPPAAPVQPDPARTQVETRPGRAASYPTASQPQQSAPAAGQVNQPSTRPAVRREWRVPWGCLTVLALLFLISLPILGYALFPGKTTILVMGVDDRTPGGALGRTDTLILAAIQPHVPSVGLLSIPRDLWIVLPDGSQNRINTAHFFAEAEQEGSGPAAAAQVVETNFRIEVDYTVRLRFDNFGALVDALGGVEINLSEPMSGYEAGAHLLDGTQALAFVRDRAGSDDFARMARGQIFLRALLAQIAQPANWARLPQALSLLLDSIDTDIPLWLYPRLGIAVLRVGADGINSRTITRAQVAPFQTEGGAQVLGPVWELIDPLVNEVIGR